MAKKNKEQTEIEPETGIGTGLPTETTPAVGGPVASPALPGRCRIIEVTEDDGETNPAIVNKVTKNEDGTVTLNVMVFHNVMGSGNACIADAAAKYRDQAGEAGTWNWPPRA